MDQPTFLQLLATAVQHGASDVHLQTAQSPCFRIKGDLIPVKTGPLTDQDMNLLFSMVVLDPVVRERANQVKDYDASFEVQNLARFRVNVFRNRGHLGIILRIVPSVVPSIEKLLLPPALKNIANTHRGLVLVTGATGSGKSSTLAALVDYLNNTCPLHIVTIEDPIEFVHTQRKARITQREVGRDTGDFAMALRAALRQDPDVILVGEMRDRETIDIALKAAETGHMVFSTVHTPDAAKTIGRLVAAFPTDEQRMARTRLADNLNAIISQRLIPRCDAAGMIAAQEILINNTAIAEAISDPELTGTIRDFIFNGYKSDLSASLTFDQHLVHLFRNKVITLKTAKETANNASDFERNLVFGAKAQGGTNPAIIRPGDGGSLSNFEEKVELESNNEFLEVDEPTSVDTATGEVQLADAKKPPEPPKDTNKTPAPPKPSKKAPGPSKSEESTDKGGRGGVLSGIFRGKKDSKPPKAA